MRRPNTLILEKLEFVCLLTYLLLLSFSSVCNGSDPNQDLLKTIIAGVQHNNSLIKNLSFDYVVDHNLSDEWKERRLASMRKRHPNLPSTLRLRTIDHTVNSGSARYEGNKIYATFKFVDALDGKKLDDAIISYDGAIFTKLDLLTNHATIGKREMLPFAYDIRKYALSFADGHSLYSWLTDDSSTYKFIRTEELQGTKCYVVEGTETFLGPGKQPKTSTDRCWIAAEKGFLVKKALSFSIKSPDKVLTVTNCSLSQVSKGIWYYSKVRFESYPLFLQKPDNIELLELQDIVVNQQLEEDAFTVRFPPGCFVNDQVAHKKYRVGEE